MAAKGFCSMLRMPDVTKTRAMLHSSVFFLRQSSSSVRRGSCRRGRRWSTPCRSTRSMSSTAAHKASWLSSLETPERSSLKSANRLTPKCASGGRRGRQRLFLGCVQTGPFCFWFSANVLLKALVCVSRCCLSMRSTCWTWSVSLS